MNKELVLADDYKETLLEEIDSMYEDYLEDSETHYPDKEETDSILSNNSQIVWIE